MSKENTMRDDLLMHVSAIGAHMSNLVSGITAKDWERASNAAGEIVFRIGQIQLRLKMLVKESKQ